MAAHFDLSRFRNPPSQLAALAGVTAQEDEMSDSRKTRPRKPDAVEATAAADNARTPGGEVNAAELVWPDGITGGEKTAALGELAALTIIARCRAGPTRRTTLMPALDIFSGSAFSMVG
jgi:hypothetical protein